MSKRMASRFMIVVAGSVASTLLVLGCAEQEQSQESADEAEVADAGGVERRPATKDTALKVEYDRFEDHTSIASPLIEGEPYHVEASYDCDGAPGCRPEIVTIALTPDESTHDWLRARVRSREEVDDPFAFLNEAPNGSRVTGSLIFLLDGENRYKVDDRERDAWQRRLDATEGPGLERRAAPIGTDQSMDEDELMGLPDWGLVETGVGAVIAWVPFEAFRAIARADEVEFRLNGYEAALTAKQLVVLRRMADMVESSQ